MRQESDDPGRAVPEYDSERRVYAVDYEETGDTELSVTVVHAVMDVTGRDPTQIHLNDVVQPDALNAIFEDKHDGTSRRGGQLSFVLAGCQVEVTSDGEVLIDPSHEE
ncbi:MAG: HalOD1 output domain-containing protein [Halobacterium sp.]